MAQKDGRIFYDGDVIPADYFQNPITPSRPNSPNKDPFFNKDNPLNSNDSKAIVFIPVGGAQFTVVVEVLDGNYEYTYTFEDDSYTLLENGTYNKDLVLYISDSFREINVGSATKKATGNVQLRYEVNSYALDHYISTDIDATSGDKNCAIYQIGQTVYLYVKIPENTEAYRYEVPDGFSKVRDQWYRKAINVSAEESDLGIVEIVRKPQSYTVTWLNWDGSVIYSENYLYGETPVFKSENADLTNPIKSNDDTYSYVFKEWDKPLDAVTTDIAYTATFSTVLLQYSIFVESTENGMVTPAGVQSVTPLGQYTYTFTPSPGYIIADVVLNGESIGAVSSYTFSGVRKDQILSVRFEKEQQEKDTNWIVPIVLTFVLVVVSVGVVSIVVVVRRKKLKVASEQIAPDANGSPQENQPIIEQQENRDTINHE